MNCQFGLEKVHLWSFNGLFQFVKKYFVSKSYVWPLYKDGDMIVWFSIFPCNVNDSVRKWFGVMATLSDEVLCDTMFQTFGDN